MPNSESVPQSRGLKFHQNLRSKLFAKQMALLWPEGVSNATAGRSRTRKNSPLVTIGALPDEILLYVFDFCRITKTSVKVSDMWRKRWPVLWKNVWHNLVHVCRRWRYVVFSSPLRLDLRLYCTDRTSARETLDVWPPFPIEIMSSTNHLGDNIVAALERHDRICDITIALACSECDKLATVMQKPFPLLTRLYLSNSGHGHIPVLPDTFLGGSAPRLRSLLLVGLPYPTLPQLLLSCNDLSELRLHDIPEIGYFSPEEMVTGLSALTRLTQLCIKFERFETIRVRGPPPVTRVLLPILIEFEFFGVHEYLEVLLARIDAPQLKFITTRFFGNHVDIQHQQVMSHLLRLTHGPFERADVRFSLNDVDIQLYRPNGSLPVKMMTVEFVDSEEALGQQILTVTQLALSLLSNITELEIGSQGNLDELDDVELVNNPGWLVLFRTFTALRTLRLRNEIQPLVLFSLQGHTEVLPGLQDLYLCEWHWQGEPLEALEQFIAARQHSDHPVTVHHVPEYYDGDWEE